MIAHMKLLLAGVPLGNPGDASARLISAIKSATIIAAEDSRRFQRLCQDLDVSATGKVLSFFEGNEEERTEQLLNELKNGAEVLVVTDAGMPTVSDPGFKLVRAAVDAIIPVEVLPGPSAVTTALALSGLPTDRFCFEGFVPRTQGAREKFFENLKFEPRTIVFFEAPHRLIETLEVATHLLGSDRKAALCREMTKTYEETVRGTLADIQNWANSKEILGEITVVISGAIEGAKEKSQQEIIDAVRKLESVGMDRKEAIAAVATELDLPKREVFDAMVAAKNV
ncbi:MAG: 16S rRNA (cytidine(1402)-2'-O)-methyltransferase [Candidatus Nanopelagicaceae bacterium]|jgi:16S rRNA (cytidine1402-2'-O)-methyltransferase